jgi:hypothetical protein
LPASFPPIQESKNLHPYYVVGFSDGVACFHVAISKRPEPQRGWIVQAILQIILNSKDKALLERIKAHFGVGVLSEPRQNVCHYPV